MIDQLFGSKTRVKLLKLFYSNPNRAFYVREITRKIDEQINSVRRELSNLLKAEIIISKSNNNRLYYEINQDNENYEPMRQIFTGTGVTSKDDGKQLTKQEEMFLELGAVKLVYLLGKFTQDLRSPVDVFIVGNVNDNKLKKLIAKLEKEVSQEMDYVVLSEQDYAYRLSVNDRFVNDVIRSKKHIVINQLEEKESEDDDTV